MSTSSGTLVPERVRLINPWLTFGVASRDPCERHGRWATVTRACLLLHPMPFQTFLLGARSFVSGLDVVSSRRRRRRRPGLQRRGRRSGRSEGLCVCGVAAHRSCFVVSCGALCCGGVSAHFARKLCWHGVLRPAAPYRKKEDATALQRASGAGGAQEAARVCGVPPE